MKNLYLSVLYGFAAMLSLNSTHAAEAKADEHSHEEGAAGHAEEEHADHDHEAEDEHQHKEGETCTDEHGHTHAESGQPVQLKLDAKAIHSLDMRFEKAGAASDEANQTIHGQMVIPPHAVETYALPSPGRVTFHVKSAQNVRKGDLLYTLASPDIVEMQGNVAMARAALDRATAELDALQQRRTRLEQIGTQNSELNTSISFKQAEVNSLSTALASATDKLGIATAGGELKDRILQIRAARDGSVQSIDLNQGAWGEQGKAALLMTNAGELEFAATVYGSVPMQHQKARLALGNGKNTEMLDGVLRVADQIDPATGSRAVYFAPSRLPATAYAGQPARLDLYSRDADAHDYISVPNSAVVKVGVDDVVFLKTGDDTFTMMKVETLPSRLGKTPVRGIEPGQTIVTKGGYELKYILPAAGGAPAKAAGHFHADGKFHDGKD